MHQLADGISHVCLNGRLDATGTATIEHAFSAMTCNAPGKIIVDLSRVSFLSSIGIRLLLAAAKAQAANGGALVLAAPQPLVRKVLEVAGIDLLVALVDNLHAAQARLAE